VGTEGGLSISNNGGGSWTTYTTANGLGDNVVYEVAVGALGSGAGGIWAATREGLSVSRSFGMVSFTNYLANRGITGVCVDGGTVWAIGDGGLWKTTDGGTSFTNYPVGAQALYVTGGTVYLGTPNSGLSISTNGGASFTNYTTANGLVSNLVRGVYATGSTVYVATSQGLSISTNGGANWTNYTTANGLGDNWVEGVHAVGNTIYAATSGGGLSISTNGGANWTTYTRATGLASPVVLDVWASSGTVYAATSYGLSMGVLV
jgi:hypothetical protein